MRKQKTRKKTTSDIQATDDPVVARMCRLNEFMNSITGTAASQDPNVIAFATEATELVMLLHMSFVSVSKAALQLQEKINVLEQHNKNLTAMVVAVGGKQRMGCA